MVVLMNGLRMGFLGNAWASLKKKNGLQSNLMRNVVDGRIILTSIESEAENELVKKNTKTQVLFLGVKPGRARAFGNWQNKNKCCYSIPSILRFKL